MTLMPRKLISTRLHYATLCTVLLPGLALGRAADLMENSVTNANQSPIAASIQEYPTHLERLGRINLKYSIGDSGTIFLFPTYKIIRATYRLPDRSGNDIPLFDTNGALTLSSGLSKIVLDVKLYNILKDPTNLAAVREILAKENNIVKANRFVSAGFDHSRPADLILVDPNDRGKTKIISSVDSLAGAEDNEFPSAQFSLGETELRLLDSGHPGLIRPEHLQVQIQRKYRARYQTTDLEICLQQTEKAVNAVRRHLASLPDGRQAGLLLSPRLPVNLAQSGLIEASNEISSILTRAVKFEVLQRVDATVDPALAQGFIQEALELARQNSALNIDVSKADRDAVVAFLLNDELSVTLPLANLEEVATEIRNHRENKLDQKFLEVVANNGASSSYIEGGGGFSIAGFGIGGSAAKGRSESWNNKSHRERMLDRFARELNDVALSMKGSMPFLIGLRFDQGGRITNIRFNDVQSRLGRFADGYATYFATSDFWDLANVGKFSTPLSRRLEDLEKTVVSMKSALASPRGLAQLWRMEDSNGDIRFSERVTFEQLNDETKPNVVASESSGVFEGHSKEGEYIPRLDVSMDTSGRRPVLLQVVADGSGKPAAIGMGNGGPVNRVEVEFHDNGERIACFTIGPSGPTEVIFPPSALSHIYLPSDGKHQYRVRVKTISPVVRPPWANYVISHVKLVAMEL